MRILISSGATREPIDEIRYISNFSTGSTGTFLADFMAEQGHQVTFLAGLGSEKPRSVRRVISFSSFTDLDQIFRAQLSEHQFDAIVHLAAVSDYSIQSVEVGAQSFSTEKLKKLDSEGEITLRLGRNPKILGRLKKYAAPHKPVVVAFKLTNTTSHREKIAAVIKLSSDSGVDFVVHNDFHDIKLEKPNRYQIYRADEVIAESLDRNTLAVEIENLIGSSL